MKHFLITLLFTFLANIIVAQKQNNIWYFGFNAGLDFNFQPPKPLYSDMVALEACASIADANGSLLFYTNGNILWDRSHQVMPNGTDLLGGPSSTQGALIVPLPNSTSIYYLFTTAQGGSAGKLAYSVIDMNLNNGFGDIVPGFKNIILLPESTEQLAAVLHANTRDVWIVSHSRNTDEFLAYLFTANGIETDPVISAIGAVYGNAGIGPIRFAHNGSRFVATQGTQDGPKNELFEFNSNTGKVSNMIDLNPILNTGDSFYGIEFSPNDSLLYLSASAPGLLLQLNLSNFVITELDAGLFDGFSALQLGPDGKIYSSFFGSEFVDIINEPNRPGISCEYSEDEFMLAPGSMFASGLPNLTPYSLFSDTLVKPGLGDDFFVCDDSLVILEVDFPVNCFPISFLWSNGSTNASIMAEVSGEYWVEVNSTCGFYRDTLLVDIANCDPLIHYGLEACQSYMSNGSHMDYSEFTPTYPKTLSCGDVTASLLLRNNSAENKHSCTPGVNESVAMCISSYPGCFYIPGHESTLYFDVTVIPTPDSVIRLTSLEFYQRAPLEYDWIDGPSGPNNYPRRVALRILKNGIEIFRDLFIEASQQWELESVSLLDNAQFTVQDSTVFRFEFLPYCTINNGATVAAWDIDEIRVFGGCEEKEVIINGLTGRVISVKGEPLKGVQIHYAEDPAFFNFDFVVTDSLGCYSIDSYALFDTTYVRGFWDQHLLNGVTVLDLVLIQKHLLSLKSFSSITEYIASDVNRDWQVNAVDLLILRKLLLGIEVFLENNSVWLFGSLPMNLESYDFNEFKVVSSILKHEVKLPLDFLGVKIGDVNGSAKIND